MSLKLDEIQVSVSEKHQIPIVCVEESGLQDSENLKKLFKRLLKLLRDSNRGIIVDCSRLRDGVSSQILKAFSSLANKAMNEERFFLLSGLKGRLRDKFEELALDATVPVYDTLDAAVMAMGPPTSSNRKTKVKKKKAKLAKKKVENETDSSSAEGWELPSISLPSWMQGTGEGESSRNGKLVPIAASCIAVTVFAMLFMNSTVRAGVASVFAAKEKVASQLTGEVKYASRAGAAGDAGAIVVAWPKGTFPDTKLAWEEVEELSETGTGRDGVFVTRVERDGSYSLSVECGESDLLNVLVVSKNLKDKKGNQAVDASSLNSMDSVFDSPTELLGDRAFDLGFVMLSGKTDLHYDVTVIQKYVP